MPMNIEALEKARDFIANNPEMTLGQGLFHPGVTVNRAFRRIREGQRIACSAAAAYLAFATDGEPQELVDGVFLFDAEFLRAYEEVHHALRTLPDLPQLNRPVMGEAAKEDALKRLDAAIARAKQLKALQERIDQSQHLRGLKVTHAQ